MAVFDIFSKREQRRSGGKPEVFEYEAMPQTVRVQIVHILKDLIGHGDSTLGGEVYQAVHDALAREYGRFELAKGYSAMEKLFNFILQESDVKRVLDAVEASFELAAVQRSRSFDYDTYTGSTMDREHAIAEVNQRFLEAGIGYQYERSEFLKITSQFLHAEAVKPVLVLLSDKRFAGAEQEFLKAHKYYREGNYKECLTECTKALESTMKTVCDIKRWKYNKTDTAKALIDMLFQNGLIPPMLQSQFNNLRALLESGVPVLRNKSAAHGQGAVPTPVPDYVAAYALHLTAANILFIVKAAGC